MLEYYDFFIYGTAAALVFGKVFFPEADPATGTLLALATYGVGYVARPVGAFFMGHIGDKYGRKRVLLLTVSLMGVSTFLVGCLPTLRRHRHLGARAAGGAAPAAGLLGVRRAVRRQLAQPRACARASTRLLHQLHAQRHAGRADHRDRRVPADRRAARGAAAELGLAHPVLAERRRGRRRPADPAPARGATGLPRGSRRDAVAKVPTAVLFRDHWAGVLRVALAAIASTVSTIFGVYALSFAVDTKGLDQTTMLWVAIATNVVALAAIPAWATLSDRIGRKPVFIFGAVGSGALMFAYLAAIASGNYPLIFLAAHPHVRRRLQRHERHPAFAVRRDVPDPGPAVGMAIGTQIGFAIGGFAPTAAAAIAGDGPERLGARGRLRARLEPRRRDRRRDSARDLQAAAARDRRAHGPRRPDLTPPTPARRELSGAGVS